MESIFEVAKYFLLLGPMNHKKLEKLCYYAQAWHLAIIGRPLMYTSFQAWVHGPVSPELWHKYKEWGGLIIRQYEGMPNFNNPDTREFLNKIYNLYGRYSGDYLESLTHQEAPWINARKGLPVNAICTNEISQIDMAKYYRGVLNPN